MAGPTGRPMIVTPRYLKATYLAQGETMLRETRGTKLYYFPGPLVVLLVLALLDLADELARRGLAGVPGLTGAFTSLHNYSDTLGNYLFYFLLFLTLLTLLWLLIRYLRWISTVYAVTTQRVIVQTGILGREFDEIPLLQIRGVDVHQTAGQRILGYGTMWVSSEGGTHTHIGNESWQGIPKPFEFQRLVEGASQNLATTRSPAFR
ncbi:MAG TPA: PH domain-containing protein [Thermoplasmata archaeon]|nr:PH domain-containing protein [Thermoplasmata archaeon]